MGFRRLACGTRPAHHRRVAPIAQIARCGLIAWVAVWAGCGNFAQSEAEPADGSECLVDSDCVAVASSCCECPGFALPTSSSWTDSCEDVQCPTPECGDVQATCREGACTLACRPIVCDEVCDSGFVVDAAGCLRCQCSPDAALPFECFLDEDCVQVPADCCGCARGGADTAVPAGTSVDGDCDDGVVCPEVDVCDPSASPQCQDGMCVLAVSPATQVPDGGSGPVGEPMLCGTQAHPSCPDGFDCVLNDPSANDQATGGVGVCVGQDG